MGYRVILLMGPAVSEPVQGPRGELRRDAGFAPFGHGNRALCKSGRSQYRGGRFSAESFGEVK